MNRSMDKPVLNFTFHKDIRKDVRIYIGEGVSKKIITALDAFRPDKVYVVCDHNVARLYAKELSETIDKKYPVHVIVHNPDETQKNLEAIVKISHSFFENGGTSKSMIVALGGGVTGNMAGFFASIVYRGIKLIHVPTTLLAQVDSAADVKQSVNSSRTKNSIGSYLAPDAVIIEPLFLKSLSDREIRSGLGEAVKHGFAQDMEFVDFISSCDIRSLAALQEIAARTISLKIEHWGNTPTIWNDSKKVERLTHLGHTSGKILEMIHVDHLTHGEAIAHGMVIEAYMSYKLGHLDLGAVTKIYSVLHDLGLLHPLSDKYSPSVIIDWLYGTTDQPVFALLKALGNPKTISTTVDRVIAESAVKWYFSEHTSQG